MKTTIVLLMAGTMLSSNPAFSAETEIDSRGTLDRVTVRADGATEERKFPVHLPAGPSVIVLRGVPAATQPDAIRVSGSAGARLNIVSSSLRTVPAGNSEGSEQLQAEKQDLLDRIAAADSAAEGARAQREMLLALIKKPEQNDDLKTTIVTVREGVAEASELLRQITIAKRPAENRIRQIDEQVAVLREGAGKTRTDILITVEAEKETDAAIAVKHNVSGANWSSGYEMALDTGKNALTITHTAEVRQLTGEDWNNVQLVLSSGRSARGVNAPALSPMRLTIAQPADSIVMRSVARRDASESAGNNLPGAALASAAPVSALPVMATVDEAVVQQNGIAVEYTVPGRVNVTSAVQSPSPVRQGMPVNPRQAPSVVPPAPAPAAANQYRIAEYPVPNALVRSVVVPAVNTSAYLQAEFTSPLAVPLPRGKALLYVDGVRVGETLLASPIIPSEKVYMDFGPDESIRVAYEPVNQQKEAGWTLGGRKTTTSSDNLVTVRNGHSVPWSVRVLAALPVSADESITVAQTLNPPPSLKDYRDIQGTAAWDNTAKPGEEYRIRLGWTITAPEGKTVSGLR